MNENLTNDDYFFLLSFTLFLTVVSFIIAKMLPSPMSLFFYVPVIAMSLLFLTILVDFLISKFHNQ